MTDLIRELSEDYPAVDVTTVVFSRDFAGVGCCVIPQERVLAIISELERLSDKRGQPQSSKQIDPAELWERYLDEIRADRGTPSPQGAMAFAVDVLSRPHRDIP
jgi:hypothetical protein